MANEREKFESTISDIELSMPFFKRVHSSSELDKSFKDVYTTREQKVRDAEITRLLKFYVQAYDAKRNSNPVYKKIIFGLCFGILVIFSCVFMYLLISFSGSASSIKVNNVVALITVSITYLTLVIGILKIITEYVFPQKEEEYITRIVEMIQQNDLKNKKANMKTINDLSKERDID